MSSIVSMAEVLKAKEEERALAELRTFVELASKTGVTLPQCIVGVEAMIKRGRWVMTRHELALLLLQSVRVWPDNLPRLFPK